MERRTLIRALIGLAIGVPVLVEAVTFFGLVERQLIDHGPDAPTPAPAPDRVGVGDELLPETAPTETVTAAEIRGAEAPRLFVLGVEVENPLEVPYELGLGPVHLAGGVVVEGQTTTGRVPAGATGEVTGAWELTTDATPAAVTARTTVYREGGPERDTATVPLAKVPVRGG